MGGRSGLPDTRRGGTDMCWWNGDILSCLLLPFSQKSSHPGQQLREESQGQWTLEEQKFILTNTGNPQ